MGNMRGFERSKSWKILLLPKKFTIPFSTVILESRLCIILSLSGCSRCEYFTVPFITMTFFFKWNHNESWKNEEHYFVHLIIQRKDQKRRKNMLKWEKLAEVVISDYRLDSSIPPKIAHSSLFLVTFASTNHRHFLQ